MKNYFNQRKIKLLFFTLLTCIVGASPTWADELTVCDGTNTNNTVPVNGNWVDTQGTISEFVMPASYLESMTGGIISKLTFYLSSPASASWGTAEFRVYVKELDEAHTYASYGASAIGEVGATTVYEGTLDGTQSTMDINFSSAYAYGGGNLLVGIYVSKAGTYKDAKFYGFGSSQFGYNYYSFSRGSAAFFLPKTTFTYSMDANYMPSPKSVKATNVTNESATATWTAGGEETSWEVSYSTSNEKPAADGSYTTVNSASYELTGLTAETTYYFFVRAVNGENKSDWSVANFTTKAAPITSFPWTENFNSLASGIPANWNNSEGTTTTDSYKWNYYATGYDGAGLRFDSYNN